MKDFPSTDYAHEPKENHGYCARCHGDDFTPDELTTMYNGDTVCNGCFSNYCEEAYLNDSEMVRSFISENEVDFLKYWWSGLDDSDRLAIVQESYRKSNQDATWKKLNHETEVEFCIEFDDYFDFLKGE